MNANARVLLAEPDGPTRTGLRLLLTREGYDVTEATDLASALDAAERSGPDAALIAVELPGGGVQLAAAITDVLPGCKVIVLSPSPGGEELLAAVLAGAAGYLSKDISLDRLPHAVRGVLDGEVALPRRYTQHLLETLRGRDVDRALVRARTGANLTDREWEVLHLLGEGSSTAQMAQRLGISEVTVRRHISALLAKLGVRDRKEAAAVLRRSAD